MTDLVEPHAQNALPNFEEGPLYQPQDAIAKTVKSAVVVGGAGLLLAAVQNSVSKQNVGAFGVFSRFGGTFALFGTAHPPRDVSCTR